MPEAARVRVIPPIAEQAKKLRVCAYARVSSDSSDQLHSFSTQISYYTDLIAQNEDWEFAGIYADEALSGTRADKRDDFQRMMSDCRAGKIDRILVKSISRFARNTIDSIESVRELRQLGIAVIFEEQQIDTGTMGSEMLLSMLSAAAQEESLSISKNLKWSYRRRMKSGDYITSSAPLGYSFKDNTLVPDPQEIPIVEYIFNCYLVGESTDEIAKKLDSGEVFGVNNKIPKWHASTIRYVLSNEKYIGDSLVQKNHTPDQLPFRREKNSGQLPKFYIENSHQGIIAKEIYMAVQKLIKQRSQLHAPKKRIHQFPLSGIMSCGICNSSFHRHAFQGENKWYCFQHRKNKDLCSMRQVSEKEIYEAFLKLYHKLKDNRQYVLGGMLSQLQELQVKAQHGNTDIIELHNKISELVKQNHALSRLQTKGCIDSAIFIERCNSNNKRVEEFRSQLCKLQEPDTVGTMLEKTTEILNLLEEGSPLTEFNQAVFKSLVEKVTVHPQKFCFHLTNGLILEEERCNT